MPRTIILIVLAVLTCQGADSFGQHANFVLFGNPNEAAAAVPDEHRFVHPITAPYFHEDSFITTDIRAWFLYHDFPTVNAIAGGNAKVGALQARLALTDRLQLVAYKDGYADFDSGAVDAEGWMDVAAGLKFNVIQDWENQLHVSIGAGYELSIGDNQVLQDDDEWRLWASVNKGFDRLHLGGTLNYFIAADKGQALGNSDHLSWHLHADYYICEWFSPVVEFNGYHVIDEGAVALPFSGVDVANLGGDASESVITYGIGGELRPWKGVGLRAAYEAPITDANDLFGYRWTFSLVLSF